MPEIHLTPKPISEEILLELEKQGFIKLFTPPVAILEEPQGDLVDTLYESHPDYGTHKLICVRKNQTEIRLTTHPENEEVIFVNNTGKSFKPLYLVIAKENESAIEEKAKAGDLTEDDFLALEIVFNDPKTCVFSVLKGAVHCEVTTPGDQAEAPIFYVTEPTGMTMRYVDLADYQLVL